MNCHRGNDQAQATTNKKTNNNHHLYLVFWKMTQPEAFLEKKAKMIKKYRCYAHNSKNHVNENCYIFFILIKFWEVQNK